MLLLTLLLLFQPLSDYQVLDEMAIRAGADKASTFHDYTRAYSHFFAPLKDKKIKFLEIGLWQGASVKLWEEYFPHAELHFMDIDLSNTKYHSPRSTYHQANQEKTEELVAFAEKTGGQFDIIIDDGGHTMLQQINSFYALFPYIKSGGIYVIEDLHTSYWKGWGNYAGGCNTMQFLKGLLDDVNFVGAHTARASHVITDPNVLKGLSSYQKEIESMHFYDSVVFIIKR